MSELTETETKCIVVNSFRYDGKDFAYTFDWKGLAESRSLATNDPPEDSFSRALFALTKVASDYLGIDADRYSVKLDTITFTDDATSIRLDLFYRETGIRYIKMSLNRINHATEFLAGDLSGTPDPESIRNVFNDKADAFRAECVRYICGARSQQPLKFESADEPVAAREQATLFGSEA